MNRFSQRLMSAALMLLTLISLSILEANAQGVKALSSASAAQSIDGVLDASGRIRPGAVGSFDPKGYTMSYGPSGDPVFRKADDPASFAPQACNDNWDSRFTVKGASNQVRAAAVDSQGNLYIAGDFTSVGSIVANRIAKWDGSSWSTLGSGLDGSVYKMEVSGSDVYVAGIFSTAGGVSAFKIAKWNGSNWSGLGTVYSGLVFIRSLAVSGADVYLGYDGYNYSSGTWTPLISKWNGSSWTTIGTGINGGVDSLAAVGTDLYAGGSFTTVGGNPANYLARWNGSSWSALGSGLNDTVYSIAISGNNVYVGGNFSTAGGSSANRIAKWNGSSWSSLASGMNSTVVDIEVVGTSIYASGYFSTAGGTNATKIARWNGSSWSPLGSGAVNNGNGFGWGNTIAAFGTDIYIGGTFTEVGGISTNNVARWDGSAWSSLWPSSGFGTNSWIATVATSGTDVYIGGDFSDAGGDSSADYIARWNGSSWSAMGSGVNGNVQKIAISGTDVYAAGYFSSAGGVSVNQIAKWNGSSWSALGTGLEASSYVTVTAMTASGTNLYVGYYYYLSGSPVFRLAKWNGSSWSAITSGFNSTINSLAIAGTDLYVGGWFTDAGGNTSADYIAKFNGSTWSALGSGVNGAVNAITVSGGNVYVGGSFDTAGGISAYYIAKWNGTSWSALGSGTDNYVQHLAISGTNIFAFGYFTTAGGITVNQIAKWDGTSWSALGGGLPINSNPYGMAFSNNDLFIVGDFGAAGCRGSAYIARYYGNSFTGASTSDWHTAANWSSLAVPTSSTNIVLDTADASISSANASVGDLQVNEGRTLTIAAGRTLTVSRSLTVNGEITGAGSVTITNCDPNAASRPTVTGKITTALVRCVNGTGSFLFPVGTANGYSPVTLSNVSGTGSITIQAKEGAYSGAATGLPANRLARWWNISGSLTSTDLTFGYLPGDLTLGTASTYKAYRISGGTATNVGGTIDTTAKTLTVAGVSQFSDWTLAEIGPTAAPAIVEGRVLDRSGRPVANASVSVTKQNGETVTVKTNNFGVYRLTGLQTGDSYVIGVFTKRWQYTPRVVTLTEDLWSYDLTPQ